MKKLIMYATKHKVLIYKYYLHYGIIVEGYIYIN